MFVDRRIGEKDAALNPEDKMIARFTAERLGKNAKKSIFNLGGGEEETLTHFGKALSEIEQFEDPRSDDEDDDKKLGASFVEETHFGGFMTKSDADFADGRANTRKEWIEQMISESKKKKAEKQKVVEETVEMTRDLDKGWKELQGKMKMSGDLYSKKDKEEGKFKKKTYYKYIPQYFSFYACRSREGRLR